MTTETLMTAPTTTEGTAATTTTETAKPGADTTAQSQQQISESTQQADQNAGTKTDASTADKSSDKPAGAPEKYEFKFEDGKALSPTVVEEFSAVAKELNLPLEAAQKVLDKMAPAIAKQQMQAIETARTSWADAAMADGEFGGAKFNENIGVARKAMDSFASPALKSLLNETGLGNHPEVIRVFVKIGQAISEDNLVTNSKGAQQTGPMDDAAMAKALYPSMS